MAIMVFLPILVLYFPFSQKMLYKILGTARLRHNQK